MRTAGLLLGLLLIAAPTRGAEVPRRLADINPDAENRTFFGNVGNFFQLGDRLLFSSSFFQDNGILWSTDGTAAGTVPLSSSLCPTGCGEIRPAGTWNGLTLLEAHDEEQDLLVRTDGTPGGTFPLLPLEGGVLTFYSWTLRTSSEAPWFSFVACRAEDDCHLWRSDGTTVGTRLLTDANGLFFQTPEDMVFWKGRLWFVARRGDSTSTSLWSSDGTPEGTVSLQEVNGDYYQGAKLVATSRDLFFTSGENGEDLWATDGTPAGTRRLADFEPTYCHPSCSYQDVDGMFVFGDLVYFVARSGDRLDVWTSDGTEAGTGPRFRLPRGTSSGISRVGGSWMFFTGPYDRRIPWILDDGLTRAVPLDCPDGKCPKVVDFLLDTPAGRLFAGSDPEHGLELWITDGTGPGTRRLTDACPGDCPGLPTPFGGSNYFQGPDGEVYFEVFPGAQTLGTSELWVTDGTPAGTRRVRRGFAPVGFLDGRVYFGAAPAIPGTIALWSLDGPAAPPRRVKVLRRFAPGSDPFFLPVRDGVVIAAKRAPGRSVLWKSDGTPEGSAPLLEFPPDDPRYISGDLGPAGGSRLLDISHSRTGTSEIWRTDGSRPGTWKLLELRPFEQVTATASWQGRRLVAIQALESCSIWSTDGARARKLFSLGSSDECPWEMADLGSRFLFLAPSAPRAGTQLFISDGTPAGTFQISSFQTPWEWGYFQLSALGTGRVYFSLLWEGTAEIWSTDGTPRGTRREFATVETPNELVLFRGSFYFTGLPPGGYERGLYRAPAGGGDPVLLAPAAGSLTPLGDRLFFEATDAAHGTEPWMTDGTPEGTLLLADLLPGPGSSWPRSLAGDSHRLFFDAHGVDGDELWETDGTADGTRQVQDLAPDGASSSPDKLTLANGFIFFAADDGRTGVEPWAWRIP